MEFRRRRSPPPAARRLLLASLSAGVVLLIALAAVFLPIAINQEQAPTVPRVTLEVLSGSPLTLRVTRVTADRPLAEYRTEFFWDNETQSSLKGEINPLQTAETPFLVFRDLDEDNILSVGDEFDLVISLQHRNRFLIVYVPAGRIVGGWPLAT